MRRPSPSPQPRHVPWALFLGVLSCGGLFPVVSRGADSEAPPLAVEVGLWLSGIHTLDPIDGRFDAEFYIWWITDDPELEPFDVLQILNGRDWSVRSVSHRTLADGRRYISGHVSVTLGHDWDLRRYPYDRQTLRIILESPYTARELRFVPDSEASVVGDLVSIQGFRVVELRLSEHIESYPSDFGIDEESAASYSRLVAEVELERQSSRAVVALLIGFIVANLIALLTFAIHVSMLAVRSSMVASAIFGAVGNMYSLDRVVHPATGSLLIDRIATGTFGVILVALLSGVVVDRLLRWKGTSLARLVNWIVFGLLALGMSVGYSWAFLVAIEHGAS